MLQDNVPMALTFDDVLLKPRESSVLPRAVNVQTNLTKQLSLNVPIISAAMDTVTEGAMAIAMAQQGSLGSSAGMSLERQAQQVRLVKRAMTGTFQIRLPFHQISRWVMRGL